jgi:RNA polymerase sigma-70 factor (ECF subfamily)
LAIEDDAELVAAAQSGDREAFEELVRRTYHDTFTLARRLTGNDEDARDVTQDTYLRAWRGIERFRGEAQFSTWLYRITANTANTHLRRRRRLRAVALDEFNDPPETRGESHPAAVVEAADLLERVTLAIDDLPEKLRSVIVLRDVYGLAHEAIAEELGISVTAAKVRLHRARRKLHDAVYDTASDQEGNAHAV